LAPLLRPIAVLTQYGNLASDRDGNQPRRMTPESFEVELPAPITLELFHIENGRREPPVARTRFSEKRLRRTPGPLD
jgi:hypothetical protein